MGSGHILVYAFDVLIQIYESVGVSPRDAAKLILEKNIYGLDIDRRAYQLAWFALMMKARQYNRRIFGENVRPQVYHPAGFPDGEEYGSLVKVDDLPPMPQEKEEITLFDQDHDTAMSVWNFKRLLAQKYDVVVTNPPYMGSSGMSGKMSEFVKKNYPDSKSDLFAVFIEKCGEMLNPNGFQAMITQHAWMFLSSYEKLRSKLLHRDIVNMAHLGARAFEEIGGEVVQTTAFVLSKKKTAGFQGTYARLVDFGSQNEKELAFLSGGNRHTAFADNFAKIPGSPVAYWVSEKMLQAFEHGVQLVDIATPRQGIATADNNRFVRLWCEVDFNKLGLSVSQEQAINSKLKWFPYNKGGDFRKWYGNNDFVVNWKNNGSEMKGFKNAVIRNPNFQFRESVTWTLISSSATAFRYKPQGHLFDVAGMSMFPPQDKLKYIFGVCNTSIVREILMILAPTLN
jgi:hypothetical protein